MVWQALLVQVLPLLEPVPYLENLLFETATQDSFDDLIAGRQLAGGLGALADHLGFDGAQFTTDPIEGRKPSAQVLTAVIGLIQNTGINFGADKLFGALGRAFPQRAAADAADSQLDEAAGVLGIDGDELRSRLGNKNEPTYSADYEPHDSIDIDSANNVVKPANEGSVISDEALIVEARRAAGIGEDGLLDAQREYFTNWKAVVDEDSWLSLSNRQLKPSRSSKTSPRT